MEQTKERFTGKHLKYYLLFMLLACSGALIWQFWFPNLAGQYSSWGVSIGWQREIALWNVALICAILFTLVKGNIEIMKILTFQCTVLCLILGVNHLISLLYNFSLSYMIHILGVFEVLLLGGAWGGILLWSSKKTG